MFRVSGELTAVTGWGSTNLWRCGLQGFFLFEARAHLCPNTLFVVVPSPPLGGRICAPQHRSRAELQGESSTSSPAKGPRGAAAPRGDQSGLLERNHPITWHWVEMQGSFCSTGAPQAAKPLSTFRERCGTKPLKCQAEEHPTGAISPCQGCSWAFRDSHPAGHQGLRCRCWQNLGTVHIPRTHFCSSTHTRALCLWREHRRWVWPCGMGGLPCTPGISQACTLHRALRGTELLSRARGDLCFCLETFPTALQCPCAPSKERGAAVCVCVCWCPRDWGHVLQGSLQLARFNSVKRTPLCFPPLLAALQC